MGPFDEIGRPVSGKVRCFNGSPDRVNHVGNEIKKSQFSH